MRSRTLIVVAQHAFGVLQMSEAKSGSTPFASQSKPGIGELFAWADRYHNEIFLRTGLRLAIRNGFLSAGILKPGYVYPQAGRSIA